MEWTKALPVFWQVLSVASWSHSDQSSSITATFIKCLPPHGGGGGGQQRGGGGGQQRGGGGQQRPLS